MANDAANDFNELGFFQAEDQCPVIDLGFPANQRDINFIVLNDIHYGDRPHLKGIEGDEGTWTRSVDGRDAGTTLKNLAAYLKGPNSPLSDKIPAVILINGDAGSRGTREEELNRLEQIVSMIKDEFDEWPVVFIPGNHDQNRILPHEYEAITAHPAQPFGLIAGSWHIPVITPVYTSVPDMGQNNHYVAQSQFDQLKEWTRKAAKNTSDMFAMSHTNLKNRAHTITSTGNEAKLPSHASVSGWNAYDEVNVTTPLIKTRTALGELIDVTKGKIRDIFCAHKHEDQVSLCGSGNNGITRTIMSAFSAVMMPRLPEYFENPADMPLQETAGNFTLIEARKSGLTVHQLSLAGLSAAPQNIAPAEIVAEEPEYRLAAE